MKLLLADRSSTTQAFNKKRNILEVYMNGHLERRVVIHGLSASSCSIYTSASLMALGVSSCSGLPATGPK